MWGFPRRRDRIDEARLDLVEKKLSAWFVSHGEVLAEQRSTAASLAQLKNAHEAFVADIFSIDKEAEEIDKARDIQIENIEAAIRNHADAIEQLRTALSDASEGALSSTAETVAKVHSAQGDITDLKSRVGGLSGEYESFKRMVLAGLGLGSNGATGGDAFAYKGRLDQIEQRARSAEGQAKKAASVIHDLVNAFARMSKFVDLPPSDDDGDPAAGPVPVPSGPKPFPPAQGVAEASLASGLETPPLCFAEDN